MNKWFQRSKARGVAILTVMIALVLMMALVTELSNKEITRYKLAINERDALQAEALAQSGLNFAQLILTVQEPLQMYMAHFAKLGIDLPASTAWGIFPIDSDLLKGITDGSFFPDFGALSSKEEKPEAESESENGNENGNENENENANKKPLVSENKAKDVPLFGAYQAADGGYGAFPGRFVVDIKDEEGKINLRKWVKLPFSKRKIIADQLFFILSKKENEILFDGSTGDNKNIGPSQLIGYIYDYISEEEWAVDVSAPKERWGKDGSGDKRAAYANIPDIMPKRALMDSLAELRLIPGMTDAIYQVLSSVVSIYAEGESINVLSASDEVLGSLFYLCAKNKEASPFQRPGFEADVLHEWNRKKGEGGQEISAEGIIAHLEASGIEVDKEECTKSIGTQSKTFTVKSTATVGTVTKTLLARLRSASGLTTLYQFQYL